jgi:catechol 2,3-dioxygenase-like lactoylglutathione lyase family enzyme
MAETDTKKVLGRLDSTMVECRSVPESARFYVDTLGLREKARGDEPFRWVVVDAGDHDIVLWEGDKSEVVIGFTGADLDAARRMLESRGLTPTPTGKHPGGEHFYIKDPEGNLVCVNT